jgi:putative CocE/NonD family hydrolase
MRCAFAALLALASPALGQTSPSYQVTVEHDVMVAMRDGVHLATDVYLPARNGALAKGRFPTILVRVPYGKDDSSTTGGLLAEALGDSIFVRRGYVVVYQDTRGRFKSEGVWHLLTDDGPDGQDTCRWIAAQPWSDGRIGMMGLSYYGGTQHALAMAGCPYLKTVVPVDAMSYMGYQSIRNAGAFELRWFNWMFYGAAQGSRQARDSSVKAILDTADAHRRDYLRLLPIRPGMTPLMLAPEYETWLVEAQRHGANDAFWKQNNIIDYGDTYQDMPVYLVGGWYDSWAGNTSANYKVLSKRLKGPVYLIMGPWIHGQQDDSAHGQVNFGSAAAIPDTRQWHLAWFDHWLKGIDNDVGRRTPFASKVRIFVMGTGDGHRDAKGRLFHGGTWRDEAEWPLARARATKLYLRSNGRLSTTPPRESSASTAYDFDPRDPVPTIGGNISFARGLMLQGAWDQTCGPHVWNCQAPVPLSARRDVLVFETEPLRNDVEVTGEVTVMLWISSTGLDTDFTAKLLDVYPPSEDFPGGFRLNLEDGIVRARFRDSLRREKLLVPGRVYPVTIRLYPTSNVFKKGHRIRLDISSSNFPRFDVNPNTGEPLGRHRRLAVATNQVYFDGRRPSHMALPVVPIHGASSEIP